jgi:membrane protein
MRRCTEGEGAFVASIITRIDVDRPVHQVYERWSRLEDMPRLFSSVLEVEPVAANRVAWTARIGGESRRWVAEVTEQVPDLRMAWRTVEGTAHEGVVTFHRLAGDATRVVVQIDWEPHGTFEKVGDVLGIVRRRVDTELDRFRDELEAAPRAATASSASLAEATARAADGSASDGRGRGAESPTQIPGAGWKDVAARTLAESKEDNVPIMAAGVAFYLMLSLVPALVAIVSVYGLVVDPAEVGEMLGPLLANLPNSAADLVNQQLESVASASPTGLGVGLVASLAAAIWSASKGMKSLIAAINAAFDETETRKFLPLRGLALLMTLGGVVVMTLSVGALTVLPGLADSIGGPARLVASILRWPLLAAVMMGSLGVLYRYAPNRDNAEWRWVTPGALLATVLWILGSALFALYADRIGNFNETYGSLGAVVVLLLWLNLTSYIVLLGAELNAETERQTAEDTTEGRPQPIGHRDAYAADTVGGTAEQVKAQKNDQKKAARQGS